MNELKKAAYNQLTKDQLIWIISQWESCGSAIIETLVDESKSRISPYKACAEISRYLLSNKAIDLNYLRPAHLKAEIEFYMGVIDKAECRKRLGLD